MRFSERMLPLLAELSHELLAAGFYAAVENVSNVLTAMQSGRWDELPDDERLIWLQRLRGLLGVRGVGDVGFESPTLDRINALLDAQSEGVRRKLDRARP